MQMRAQGSLTATKFEGSLQGQQLNLKDNPFQNFKKEL